jgi:hypothetical protein
MEGSYEPSGETSLIDRFDGCGRVWKAHGLKPMRAHSKK